MDYQDTVPKRWRLTDVLGMTMDDLILKVFVTIILGTVLTVGHPGTFGALWFVWLGVVVWISGTPLLPKPEGGWRGVLDVRQWSPGRWVVNIVTLILAVLWVGD